MKKKIYAALMAIPMFMSTLVGCSSLHTHTISSPYEYDETSHWKTCKTCHKKFDEHEHTFNDFNDKCFICDYVDPLVHINEGGEITGLTPHGKKKVIFNVPHEVNGITVIGIGKDAFNGSQAVTVKLNKELDYYYSNSFTNSSVRIINTEEELVKWEQPDRDGKINKIRVFDNNVAMLDNKFYPTLQEAFDAVRGDDATITLLRDELNIDKKSPIQVKHAVSLVSYYSKTNLTCNFNIDTVGILYIPETINYQGDVKLILGTADEVRARGSYGKDGNETQSVNTTGAVVFVNKKERPKNVNVSYTHSFGSGEEGVPAHGAVQIVNDAIIALPRKHFAFGTFTFNDNFQAIRGLTKYGLTVNGLNITKVAEYIDAYIGGHAFSVASIARVKISGIPPFDDTKYISYYFLTTKGLFFDLTIGEGIKKVLGCAFNSRVDGDFSPETIQAIAPLISHLSSVTIGPDVTMLEGQVFYENVFLSKVAGGENLTSIGEKAFQYCYNLKSVDFSHSKRLWGIGENAFKGCTSLIYMNLPEAEWRYGTESENFGYFPYDMTPEKIAYYFASGEGSDEAWFSKFSNKPYSYTAKTSEDSSGAYNKVEYTDSLEDAMRECASGGEIYIARNKGDQKQTIYYDDIKANLTITAAPGVKNIYIAQNENTPDITINSDVSKEKHLILSNVIPEGKIILKADTQESSGATKHTAGFAIRGVNDNDLPEVDLITNDGQTEINNLVGSESIIRGLTYEHTYGMFNFRVDGDTTYIHDTSPFGDQVQAMTITRQTEEARNVELVDRAGVTDYDNNSIYITLSSDVKKIGKQFFSAGGGRKPYDKLERLVCEGEGLKTIGERAFEGCDALTYVSLSNSVESIGEAAFNSCDELAAVNIPTSLTTIPKQCFRNCPMLESIDIPDSVTTIEDQAFYESEPAAGEEKGPAALKYVTFGEGLTSIGKEAFYRCEEITRLEFPKSLTTIGESAFSGCSNLAGVYLRADNKLQTIGANAFKDCETLSCFYFAGNVNNWSAGTNPLSADDLTDEFIAATYLRDTYVAESWTRAQA